MDHAIERLSLIFAGILVSHESSTGTDEFLIGKDYELTRKIAFRTRC
jgi:hypothetical protein